MLLTILALSLSAALEPRTSSCVPDAISIAPSHQFYFGKKFSSFDVDGDSVITMGEFTAKADVKEAPDAEVRSTEVAEIFEDEDDNGDGQLTGDEWWEARTCD